MRFVKDGPDWGCPEAYGEYGGWGAMDVERLLSDCGGGCCCCWPRGSNRAIQSLFAAEPEPAETDG